jgi:hypothetical protein
MMLTDLVEALDFMRNVGPVDRRVSILGGNAARVFGL